MWFLRKERQRISKKRNGYADEESAYPKHSSFIILFGAHNFFKSWWPLKEVLHVQLSLFLDSPIWRYHDTVIYNLRRSREKEPIWSVNYVLLLFINNSPQIFPRYLLAQHLARCYLVTDRQCKKCLPNKWKSLIFKFQVSLSAVCWKQHFSQR